MTDAAEMSMFVYAGLQPKEEEKLKLIEGRIVLLLTENFRTERPIWSGESEGGDRSICLILPGGPERNVLVSIPESEFSTTPTHVLLSRIQSALET